MPTKKVDKTVRGGQLAAQQPFLLGIIQGFGASDVCYWSDNGRHSPSIVSTRGNKEILIGSNAFSAIFRTILYVVLNKVFKLVTKNFVVQYKRNTLSKLQTTNVANNIFWPSNCSASRRGTISPSFPFDERFVSLRCRHVGEFGLGSEVKTRTKRFPNGDHTFVKRPNHAQKTRELSLLMRYTRNQENEVISYWPKDITWF